MKILSSILALIAFSKAFPIQKAALPDALRSWGLPPPPSKRSQVHASRPHHPSMSRSSKANSEHKHQQAAQAETTMHSKQHPTPTAMSERILDSSTVYVGPPRRKAGRPGKANEGASDPSVLSAQPTSDNAQPNGLPSDPNPDPSLVNFLSRLSSSAQNAALISALSAIDGQGGGTPNHALVEALKYLLSSSCAEPNTKPPAPQPEMHHKLEHTSDDDIVILDKENVNPTAFRRRADREDMKPLTSAPNAPRPVPLGNKQNSSPLAAESVSRKRRFNDLMDERGCEHNARNTALSRVDALALHGSLSSGWRSMSTPRPGPSDENLVGRGQVAGPATSPARPARRHGVPEWARTTTATQPRFSKAMEEQLKERMAEGKKKGKGQRRGGRRASDAGPKAALKPAPAPAPAPPLSAFGARTRSEGFGGKLLPPPPVTASAGHHLPIFASDLSLSPSSPPSPQRMPPIPALLQTPKRLGDQCSPAGFEESSDLCSLFTPTPRSWGSGSSRQLNALSSNQSPLSSPRFRGRKERTGKGVGGNIGEFSCDIDEDSDLPPSSLPVASSEAEMELSEDDREIGDCATEHWAGLPPSSPPPPTSPPLVPQDAGQDEIIGGIHAFMDGGIGSGGNGSSNMSGQDEGNFSFYGGLDNLFTGGDLENIFEQFSCGQEGDKGGLGEGFADFDFSEFWESVKGPMEEMGSGGGDVEHTKLAAEVQALFSGCLV
jgi:hypothetical protein